MIIDLKNVGEDSLPFKIDEVEVSPKVVEPKDKIKLRITGNLANPVLKGAYLDCIVEFGHIIMMNQSVDLFDAIDKDCPLHPGSIVIEKTLDAPQLTNHGVYTVTLNAYNSDYKPLASVLLTVDYKH